jgi:4-diphosphocytidyl-2-C-methyl-D-erythritol kinase
VPDAVAERAPAKLNLYLEVLGKRDDGFHELATVMTTLDLADDVRVSLRPRREDLARGIPDVTLEASTQAPFAGALPPAEDNLMSRAAVLFLTTRGLLHSHGVDLELVKRVPAGGGLGGGSSDAAAVLRALGRSHDGTADPTTLTPLAAALGSDVPFFLYGGTCMCKGRGERVRPIDPPRSFDVVLLLPPFGVSTPAVYAVMRAPACNPTTPRGDHDVLVEAYADADPARLRALYRNDLEAPAARVEPRLARMLAGGGVGLSGSGSTLFVIGREVPASVCLEDIPSIECVRSRAGGR